MQCAGGVQYSDTVLYCRVFTKRINTVCSTVSSVSKSYYNIPLTRYLLWEVSWAIPSLTPPRYTVADESHFCVKHKSVEEDNSVKLKVSTHVRVEQKL